MPDDPRVLVLGAGRSGRAAALLLRDSGTSVCIADQDPASGTDDPLLRNLGIALHRGPSLPCGKFARAIVSPGFTRGHRWLRSLASAGIPMQSELSLAASHWPGRILAVTGSKGKSSVVKLCTEALRLSGRSAEACGNYGLPWSAVALDSPGLDWAVVEVSSFQLEWPLPWRPRIAVLLNLLPDHLERHGSMNVYRKLKMRLFRGQQADDLALLPEGFRVADSRECRGQRQRFGTGPQAHWRYMPGRVVAAHPAAGDVECRNSWFDNALMGPAAAAAVGALTAAGVDGTMIATALRQYRPLPHRMQDVGEILGVRFVNDSKATCLAALAAAVNFLPGGIRLIAGGLLKESDLTRIKEKLAFRVRKAYLIGIGAKALEQAWRDRVDCECCTNLDQAVMRCWEDAQTGETILLSPGCASFDQFVNYEARGEAFMTRVRELLASTASASGGRETDAIHEFEASAPAAERCK